jgi:transcriptional regulator with XRE-family HTH domain
MSEFDPKRFGANLRNIRRSMGGISQTTLARRSDVNRTTIVKTEAGSSIPRIDEIFRIAAALKIPIQKLMTGKSRPQIGLKGIAFELHDLGIKDYVISEAIVPGAFRRSEEVLVLALRGDRPDVRLIAAMPYVLARRRFHVGLTLAFANLHDRRVRARLAWLSEITLSLGRDSRFPVAIRTEAELERLIKRCKRPDEPDSLGYPSEKRPSPLWRRWNINFAGDLDAFLNRAIELAALNRPGDG